MTDAGHGLSDSTVRRIQGVLASFPAVERAALFGSRAKGVHKAGSDIDLALYGPRLDWRILGCIEEALEDLLLPYTFSLLHHTERTDPAIADQIVRFGVPFYVRDEAAARLP